MLTADDLHRRPVCFFIELPRVVIPAVVVEVSGVDVEHQLAELGGVGFQAARRDDLFFLHLAEHPNIIVRGRFEVDVKLRALRHDVGIDIGFLLTLVVRLRVADVGVGHVDVADTGTVSRVSCHRKSHPFVEIRPAGVGGHFLREV